MNIQESLILFNLLAVHVTALHNNNNNELEDKITYLNIQCLYIT